jgi:hypothetical protein
MVVVAGENVAGSRQHSSISTGAPPLFFFVFFLFELQMLFSFLYFLTMMMEKRKTLSEKS